MTTLRRRGLAIRAFKKGPDFIDPAWLGRAAGSVCRNLDTYLVAPDDVRASFLTHATGCDLALIEGNRGLFDGQDAVGTHSTARLAKLLGAPVVLVINVTKTTRTIAALVKGCVDFEPDITIAGVILNRVAGERHGRVISEAVIEATGLPVLGMLPKLGDNAAVIPGRHLGLVPPEELSADASYEDRLVEIGENFLNIDRLLRIADDTQALPEPAVKPKSPPTASIRLAYFHDSVFTFYYPENLEALQAGGAELVPISSIRDRDLPDVDGLYIGGGFPETQADQLTANRDMMEAVKLAAEDGMPIYAECGGLIYLSRSITWQGKKHLMAGVFPLDLAMSPRPVGHGYAEVSVEAPNPFFGTSDVVRGHEFHYSSPVGELGGVNTGLAVRRGVGVGDGRDGLLCDRVMACYMHIHASGVSGWAKRFVAAGLAYRNDRRSRRSSSATAGNELDEGHESKSHPSLRNVMGW